MPPEPIRHDLELATLVIRYEATVGQFERFKERCIRIEKEQNERFKKLEAMMTDRGGDFDVIEKTTKANAITLTKVEENVAEILKYQQEHERAVEKEKTRRHDTRWQSVVKIIVAILTLIGAYLVGTL